MSKCSGQEVFEQYFSNLGRLLGGGVATPGWLSDGGFWIAEGAPADTRIWRFDPHSGECASLFDVGKVRKAVAQATGFEPAGRGLPFSTFVDLGDGDSVQVQLADRDWVLSRSRHTLAALPGVSLMEKMQGRDPKARMTPRMWKRRSWLMEPMETTEVLSPDLSWWAGVRDGNIYLRSIQDGREIALTSCGTADQAWDIESLRMRVSAGCKLTFTPFNSFSPTGLRLFACKVDSTRVFKAPQVNYLKRDEEVQWVPHVRAGAELDQFQPYLIDVLSGHPTRLDIGDVRNHYVQYQGWLPDGSEVFFVKVTRDFKTITVLAANAVTGAVRVVLEESAKTFVRIQHNVIYFNDCGFKLLPDGSGFIWESERSGWKHFYLYDLQGKLQRQLTQGDFAVTEIDAVDPRNGLLYFSAHSNPARPYDVHVCRVPLSGGKMEVLTDSDGLHQPLFSPDFSRFIDIHGSIDRPMQSDLRQTDGKLLATVARTDMTAIQQIGWRAPEEFKVLAADGETELWGVLYKPHDFDPAKKYPVIEVIYGGPQLAYAARTLQFMEGMRPLFFPFALAQLGYVVVMVDGRGTPERSKAFQDVVYGEWGQHVVDDHAAALRQLGERHEYLDMQRVGIWGHSWGGHFAFRCLALKPDVYHAAFASAPGFSAWDALLYEPYLNLPQFNKAAYDASSCFPLAGQIKGKLSMAAGSSDVMCYHDMLEMSRKLIECGVDHETVVVAGDLHGFMGKAEDYIYRNKIVTFFEQNVMNRKMAGA